MTPDAPGDPRLLPYLLGRLDGAERDRFEEEYFADDTLHEQLLQAESELIESYLEKGLDAESRRQFEVRYLASESGWRRLEFARALREKSSPVEQGLWGQFLAWLRTPPPAYRLAWTAAAVVLAVIAAGVLMRRAGEPEIARQPAPAPPVFTFVLLPVERSSGGENRLVLPARDALVRLVLPLERAESGMLAAVVETVEGRQVRRFAGLRALLVETTGTAVLVDLAAAELATGDYLIRVEREAPPGRIETLADFSFRVTSPK